MQEIHLCYLDMKDDMATMVFNIRVEDITYLRAKFENPKNESSEIILICLFITYTISQASYYILNPFL